MQFEEIKRRFELLKKVTGKTYCLVTDLAKELKERKTDLMQFIEDNPKNFATNMIQKITGSSNRNLGLAITQIYSYAYENPTTEEWLEHQKDINKNCIWVSTLDYYGYNCGNFIELDTLENSNSIQKEYLWRNTEEKINKLVKQKIVEKHTFVVGSFTDNYNRTCDYALLGDWEKKLKENGWIYKLF